MQRRERIERLDLREHLVGDERSFGEFLAAMHDAMGDDAHLARAADDARFLRGQLGGHRLERLGKTALRQLLFHLALRPAMREPRAVDADALDLAARLPGFVGRVVEAVFERRRAAVDDEDFLGPLALELEAVRIVALPQRAAAFAGSARIAFIRSAMVREICCTAPGSATMTDWNSDTGISSTSQRDSAMKSASTASPVIRAIALKSDWWRGTAGARWRTTMKTAQPEGSLRPQTRVTVLLAIVIAVFLGAAVGLGGFTFVYAKGASYLGNDPNACANCHIMRDHLDAYTKSSHRAVATCNDCHTPPGLVPKYLTKAEHGFFHSLAFTTGNFHDPIQIKSRSLRVTENSCRKCHAGHRSPNRYRPNERSDAMSCIRCHASVGHWE